MVIERLNKIIENLKKYDLTQMVITDPASIFYLTGRWIEPGERFLALYVNSEGSHKIVINELFTVPEELGVDKIFFSDTQDGVELLSKYIDRDKPIGIDKNMIAKFLLRLMDLGVAPKYVCSSECVDRVRACKDIKERDFMRIVSNINDKAMNEFKKLIVPGVSELDIARQMEDIYIKFGADGFSFSPLVAFGANAAIGHHEPDNTLLKEGDCVLLDVGCKKDSYSADMTRTFFYKSYSEKAKEVYEIVKKANETAEKIIRPGVRFCDVDMAARNVIESAGYGEYFTHRLGHSIGIEVHEFGDVSSKNCRELEEGMIFSIEPGVYLPDELGVRIEDLVLVTKDGVEILNSYSKELEIVCD